MATLVLVVFLALHGLLHAAIWLPHPPADPDRPPPFEPDHSGVLTAVSVPRDVAHGLAVRLAVLTTTLYVLGAAAVWADAPWAVPVTTGAALSGITLKTLFFHPWLTLGLLLDVTVLGAAVLGQPVALS